MVQLVGLIVIMKLSIAKKFAKTVLGEIRCHEKWCLRESARFAKPTCTVSQTHLNSTSPNALPSEKKLFTPGPLCVSATVKTALCRDMGSRDTEFIQIIRELRESLVKISGLSQTDHTAVLMQGSGTFAIESVLQSTSDRKKKVLIVANGAYGQRMKKICDKAGIPNELLSYSETEPIITQDVIKTVTKDFPGEICTVAVVHCETTSGILNPIEQLGQQLKSNCPSIIYIVDAMSSFAGLEADYSSVDFLVSSANKCAQGIPGFAFVIAKIASLEKCQNLSTSLALDLYDQWKGLETTGQFRFTPPTHAILGLRQALAELEAEGSVSGRAKRYKENNDIIKKGMAQRGFKQLLKDPQVAGTIITSFYYPNHPNFSFEDFYNKLSELDQLIYPGKVTNADCFRIGNIGNLNGEDMKHLLNCIDKVLQEMGIPIPIK